MSHRFQIIISILISICFTSFSGFSGKPGGLYPEIQQIDDHLYVGKSPRGFWLLMEQVTPENVAHWRRYSDLQNDPRVVALASARLKSGSLEEGAGHFNAVLRETSYLANEIWIAFASKAAQPTAIPDLSSYDGSYVQRRDHPWAKDVLMTMTVTSNPQALLTSHLGIAASAESTLSGDRPKGISLDLHAFAARVMLKRNPHRRYMVNAPAFAMERLILNALPNATFVGTHQMREMLDERHRCTFEYFKAKEGKEIEDLVRGLAEDELRSVKIMLVNARKQDPDFGPQMQEKLHNRFKSKPFVTWPGPAGDPVIDEAVVQSKIDEQLREDFKLYQIPFRCGAQKEDAGLLSQLMAKHPPMIEVDSKAGVSFDKTIVFFDPKDPEKSWLALDRDQDRETYNWMFTPPFKPAGNTHFIMVDLKAMAGTGKFIAF